MVKLTDVTGIGPATAKLLFEHQIKTVAALASISLTELQKVSGFSDIRARAVKKAAADCVHGNAAKQLPTATSHSEPAVKKVASQKPIEKMAVVNQAPDQVETDTDKDKDKKKNKKDDKKKEKIKDKKQKDKKKDKKKKDKKKDKMKSKNKS